jgi:DNA-binding transcriptional LysR family regulator
MKRNTYPNPWDLIYFQEIALTENLSRAAERLSVAQPTLSLSLSRLENQMGAKLFKRKSKGLALTDAGDRLLKQCHQLLTVWESIVSETKKSQTELKGRFRFGCHASVAIYALNPWLSQFYNEYHGIEFQLIHGLSRVICEQIISGGIDFGIVVNPIQHPELVIKQLARDEVAFWRANKTNQDTLIYNPSMIQSQSMLKRLKQAGFMRSISSDSLEVIASLAQSGAGVAILPTRVAKGHGLNLQRATSYPTYKDEISFVYRADINRSESVKAIVDFFKKIEI